MPDGNFEGFGDKELKIAMLGMVDGNGHPYSWSAIFNGYDPADMAECPYPGICAYLDEQPRDALGIDDAWITHIWTDDPADAPLVARASLIPNVVAKPEDVIGEVDAVIIATDKGHEHVERCRPFVEAGIPIFVDKPMVDNAQDLAVFRGWVEEGCAILSGSALAYTKEFLPYRESTQNLGQLRYVSISMAKSWERYGIHALSAIYPILGPGFVSARNTGEAGRDIVHFKHAAGMDVIVATIADLYGGLGQLQLCGTKASAHASFSDTFYAFKAQLLDFVSYLRTGTPPFPWTETEELMKMLIAGCMSREQGGREVALPEVL
ncbi:MAG: Gfo/Idh/MocA family oxidoreductase [Nitrospiraceae bacterium]|nr:Gfo/Idh/MocA family oxidoreductase [Nitrospiraceae bacterium]